MKLVTAIIPPHKLQAVLSALSQAGVERLTVCDAQGFARQRGRTETYRGHEYQANLLRKVGLEIVVNDDYLERTVDAIVSTARTGELGNIGDGKIFIQPVTEVVRIGKTVRGKEAV